MMKSFKQCLPLFALALLPSMLPGIGYAAGETQADSETQQPAASMQHQHHRGPKTLTLLDSEDASYTLWKPDLTTQPLQANEGQVVLPSTGIDNYHVVVAEKDWGDRKEAAIRYEYMRGRPSHHSTQEMTAAQKTTFEIIPDPVPREHYHYHSDQTWAFILRFQGVPVDNTKVILETDNGSMVEGITDAEGRVRLHIPDDFPNLKPGERDRRTADLRVSAEHQADGITYQTQLSADYRVNPSHWQSIGWGVTVAGLGFLVGGFIGRTGKAKNRGKDA